VKLRFTRFLATGRPWVESVVLLLAREEGRRFSQELLLAQQLSVLTSQPLQLLTL
jgi:hypothetical protein